MILNRSSSDISIQGDYRIKGMATLMGGLSRILNWDKRAKKVDEIGRIQGSRIVTVDIEVTTSNYLIVIRASDADLKI